jgi:hypothetical protein
VFPVERQPRGGSQAVESTHLPQEALRGSQRTILNLENRDNITSWQTALKTIEEK